MKRHFPGLHVEPARERVPGRHLPGASGPGLLSLAPTEALLHPQLHGHWSLRSLPRARLWGDSIALRSPSGN